MELALWDLSLCTVLSVSLQSLATPGWVALVNVWKLRSLVVFSSFVYIYLPFSRSLRGIF